MQEAWTIRLFGPLDLRITGEYVAVIQIKLKISFGRKGGDTLLIYFLEWALQLCGEF